jgi:hypothetical protein
VLFGFLVLAMLAATLLPFAAGAESAVVAVAPRPSLLELVLQYVVAPMLPLVCAGLLALLTRAVTYLTEKQRSSVAARIGAVAAEAARSVVAELDVTLKPQLQAALADGQLTDAEKAQLKATALQAMREKLPPALMAQASGVFGPLLETWLGGLVERAVTDRKASEAVGALSPQTP